MATGYARVTRLLLLCCDRRSPVTSSPICSYWSPTETLSRTIDVHHAPWLVCSALLLP